MLRYYRQLFISGIVLAVALTLLSGEQTAAAMRFEGSADETGFVLHYAIPGVARGTLMLEEPGDSGAIPINAFGTDLAEMEFTLNEIIDEPPTVNIHYVLSSSYVENQEGDQAVPFGSFGAVLNPLGLRFMRPQGHDFEASVLITNSRAKYVITVDLPPLIVGQEFSGTATPAENTVQETITSSIDGSLLAEITVAFFLPADDLELPENLFTIISIDFDSHLPSIDDAYGTLPVPNGSYLVWYDFEGFVLP